MLNLDFDERAQQQNKRHSILEYFTICFFVFCFCLRLTYIYVMISFRPSRTRLSKRDYDDDKTTKTTIRNAYTHQQVVIRFDMVASQAGRTDKMAVSKLY